MTEQEQINKVIYSHLNPIVRQLADLWRADDDLVTNLERIVDLIDEYQDRIYDLEDRLDW